MLENGADILCVNFKSKRKDSIVGGQLLVISREIRIIFEDELRMSDLGRPFFDFPR